MIVNKFNPFMRIVRNEHQDGDDNTGSASSFFSDLDSMLGKTSGLPPKEKDTQQQQQKTPEEEEEEQKRQQQQQNKNDDPPAGDDKPQFKRTQQQQKQKPTKEDSVEELRKQRDELKTNLENINKTIGVDASLIGPITGYLLERANGPISKEFIETFLEDVKGKDTTISELQKQLKERDDRLGDIDIRLSPEFKQKYEKPWVDAQNDLLWSFAQPHPTSGETLAPIATKKLFAKLTEKSSELNHAQVQLALREYAGEYKKEMGGEEVILPSMNDVMRALRVFESAKQSINSAYTNWGQEKQKAARELAAQQESQATLLNQKARRERVNQASIGFQNFDFDAVDFVKEDEIEKMFNEEFEFGEQLFKKDGKIPEYNELIQRGVKARLWDMHVERLKKLIAEEKKKTKEVRGGDGGDSKRGTTGDGKSNWLGDASRLIESTLK